MDRAGLTNDITEHARRIGLVITGGTIGSEYESDQVVRLPRRQNSAEIELLTSAWPGPMKLDLHVRHPLSRLSENMIPTDWLEIASAARRLADEADVSGVLILHGTDTAIYTSAALAFLLADLNIPIVLTGSNLPPNQAGSDAGTNLRGALTALCNLGPGSYLSFAGATDLPTWVHLGTHVRKLRASGQAFVSVNRSPVAQVVQDDFIPVQLPASPRHVASSDSVDHRVLSFRIYPGCSYSAFYDAVISGGARGVVVEVYASGTGPDLGHDESLPEFIRQCTNAGVNVVAAVAVAPERAANLYESAIAMREAGAQFFWDLLPEVAIVKLMWALGQAHDPTAVRRLMMLPIAEELTEDD